MPRDLKLLNTRTLMWHQKEFIVELRSAASSLSNLSRSCERTRARDFVIHPSIHSFEAAIFLPCGSQSVSRWRTRRRMASIRFTFREGTWAAAKKDTHCPLPGIASLSFCGTIATFLLLLYARSTGWALRTGIYKISICSPVRHLLLFY